MCEAEGISYTSRCHTMTPITHASRALTSVHSVTYVTGPQRRYAARSPHAERCVMRGAERLGVGLGAVLRRLCAPLCTFPTAIFYYMQPSFSGSCAPQRVATGVPLKSKVLP